MNSKKALKKLKKAVINGQLSGSKKQLRALEKQPGAHRPSTQHATSGNQPRLTEEVKTVANQALMQAANELIAPLNPLLSWFGGINVSGGVTSASPRSKVSAIKQSANDASPIFAIKSVGHLPLKSPPCKRCPALSNGICKCAAKKFSLSA
ncbi:hypothetical protein ACS18Q_06245 [Vibrio sp. Vf1514]|uniref:hypothetical protein n=1 Tax=Vibrio sp. Vf1514 TaxID=3437381 RepID=UPI003F88E572